MPVILLLLHRIYTLYIYNEIHIMISYFKDDTKENGKIEKKKKKHLGHLYHAAKHIDFDSESNASSDVTTDENIQVFGPTTRRKWTEWTAKPAPSASPSSPEKTENVSWTMATYVCLSVSCVAFM